MTKGTREWNDAVNEINESVLDLIDEYPELASVVETDADGVMRIDMESEEVDAIMDKYQKKAQTAKAAEIGAKLDVIDKKKDVSYNNLSHEAKYDKVTFGSVMAGVGAGIGAAGLGGLGAGAGAGWAAGTAVAENAGRGTTEAVAKALADGVVAMENGEMVIKNQAKFDELNQSMGLTQE
jgi:hypothetical protein